VEDHVMCIDAAFVNSKRLTGVQPRATTFERKE
jgi:hypothetical protein